jgi:protein-S-isoprenylcysteine O-methyltransferase Ste14
MKPVEIIPPVYLFLGIAIMVVLHGIAPGTRVLMTPWNALGCIPLALGIGINLAADRAFKRHATTVKPLGETSALITTGVFRISRHPMYLGFVLMLFGIAILMGSMTPFVVVPAFAVFVDIVFITLEEERLEETFGEEWLDYRRKVRRWV